MAEAISLIGEEDYGLRTPRAVILALVVEAVLMAAIIYWMSHTPSPMPAAQKAPMKLALVTLPQPPKPASPKPVQPSKPQPPKPAMHHIVRQVLPSPPQPAPVVQQAVVVPPPPPPAPAVSASPDEIALFEGQVREAIQAAVVYPAAARMLGRQGRARVAFDYRDGAITNIALVQGTGFGPLDDAALAAVRSAHYPTPVAKLAHKLLHMVLWVRFDELSGE